MKSMLKTCTKYNLFFFNTEKCTMQSLGSNPNITKLLRLGSYTILTTFRAIQIHTSSNPHPQRERSMQILSQVTLHEFLSLSMSTAKVYFLSCMFILCSLCNRTKFCPWTEWSIVTEGCKRNTHSWTSLLTNF